MGKKQKKVIDNQPSLACDGYLGIKNDLPMIQTTPSGKEFIVGYLVGVETGHFAIVAYAIEASCVVSWDSKNCRCSLKEKPQAKQPTVNKSPLKLWRASASGIPKSVVIPTIIANSVTNTLNLAIQQSIFNQNRKKVISTRVKNVFLFKQIVI